MYYRRDYYVERRSPTLLGSLFRLAVFLMVVAAAVVGGLWVLGTLLGLGLGLLALAITFAPVILVVWLVWLLFKAIFY